MKLKEVTCLDCHKKSMRCANSIRCLRCAELVTHKQKIATPLRFICHQCDQIFYSHTKNSNFCSLFCFEIYENEQKNFNWIDRKPKITLKDVFDRQKSLNRKCIGMCVNNPARKSSSTEKA
jgi:hypothetical protein